MEEDQRLIVALKANDHKAFDSLFRKYAEKLYNFSLAVAKDKFVAEEVVQIVFFKVWDKRSQLSEHHSFKSFLFTIAYHEIITWIRKAQSEQRKTLFFHAGNNYITHETEIKIDFQNFETLANKLIDRLPEKRKEIFRLSRYQGLSNKEIAEKMHLSVKTVENQITAALKYLRNSLGKESVFGVLFFFISFH